LAYVVTGMEGQPSGCSLYPNCWKVRLDQWEFQDPKMEVLYHIRPYFGGILPYISLTYALYMDIYGRYLQFGFLEWPLIGRHQIYLLGGLKGACVHKSASMALIHAPLQLNHFMCVGR
jgi:hypothetical protein